MIKQIYVCECEICGAVEKAKAVNAYRNDTDYQMPNDWTHGKNSEICICPNCSKKLNNSKPTPSLSYSINAEAVPVYGCPAVVLDNLHDARLSSGSQGISSESTNVKAATDKSEISINDIAVTDVKKSKDFIISCAYTLKNFCTAQSDCNNCILQGECRCILADYDICDWDKQLVLDRLDTIQLHKEYDAAKALIRYCNNCSCTARTCIFSNQSNICICSRGLPENWNLKELSENSVTTEDPTPVYGCSATTVLRGGLDE